MMKRATQSLILVAACMASAPPAVAAVTINGATAGQTFSVSYIGQVNGAAAPVLSATQDFTFTGLTNGGLTYNFTHVTTNTSSVQSLLRAYGFNVAGTNPATVVGTGALRFFEANGQFPEGQHSREVCFSFSSNGSCAGGPGGIAPGVGQQGAGSFSLTFASALTSVTFDNFIVRYQSISPAVNGGTSGIGLPNDTPAVPEPATWLMMILGFGGVGAVLRRRRAQGHALTFA